MNEGVEGIRETHLLVLLLLSLGPPGHHGGTWEDTPHGGAAHHSVTLSVEERGIQLREHLVTGGGGEEEMKEKREKGRDESSC